MQIEFREDYGVILFRVESGGVVTLKDVIEGMRSYFGTPGFSPSGGGVWDFRGAFVEMCPDEAANFWRPLFVDGRYPRSQSKVGLLVDSETNRNVLLECKAVAGLTTEWQFSDNLESALGGASN